MDGEGSRVVHRFEAWISPCGPTYRQWFPRCSVNATSRTVSRRCCASMLELALSLLCSSDRRRILGSWASSRPTKLPSPLRAGWPPTQLAATDRIPSATEKPSSIVTRSPSSRAADADLRHEPDRVAAGFPSGGAKRASAGSAGGGRIDGGRGPNVAQTSEMLSA